MASNITKAAQTELFSAETTWFHIFRNMIANGDVAKMGPYAFATYCVIKAHTNFSTGMAFPSIDLIAEKTGISLAQVKRELKTLEAMDYLTKEKKGRSNHYQLRERLEIQDAHGRPQAVATWDYLPSGVQAAIAELKNAIVSGNLGGGSRVVHIEQFTVNIHTGSGPQINLSPTAATAKDHKNLVASWANAAKKGIAGIGEDDD